MEVPNSSPGISPTISPTLRPRNLSRKLVHFVLHSPVLIKAQLLLAIVVLGSTLQALDVVPETVLSDKENPLNKYLAKFSWMWTLMWVIPTVSITGALYTALMPRGLLRHLGRVLTGHIVWYSITTLINTLHSQLGQCTKEDIMSVKTCVREGHEWIGFDISGHIFIMTYCVFLITEEAANIKLEIWDEYENTLSLESRVIEKADKRIKWWLEKIYTFGSYFVEGMELFGLSLVLVWCFVMTTTSLYFHTFQEKLMGCVIAIVMWWFTYRVVYGRHDYLPCKPTYGLLHPLKHLKFSN